jgi:hypothetical protein
MRTHGLGELADELIVTVRPAWRLEPADGSTTGRVGGGADLASSESWPHSRAGVPLVFLAQVDCSALPSPEPWADLNPWAHGGQLLRVFADLIDPDYGPSTAVGLACSPDSELRRVQRPPAPDPLPRRLVLEEDRLDDSEIDDRFHDIDPTAVALVPFLTAPERHPVLFPGAFALDERVERYERWALRLRVDGAALDYELRRRPWEVSHLLGEAVSVQDDPRYHAALVHRTLRPAGLRRCERVTIALVL